MPRQRPMPTKAERLAAIKALRGILRPKPGEVPFVERRAKWKAEERALEKRHDDLLISMGKKNPRTVDKLAVRLQRLKAKAVSSRTA